MADNNIKNILKAADCVINAPSTTIVEACSKFGIAVSLTTGYVMGPILIPHSPILAGAIWVYNKITQKQKEKEEKERMKNEVIRKQQAIIRELTNINKRNQQEIKNLKDTLNMLEDVLNRMEAA